MSFLGAVNRPPRFVTPPRTEINADQLYRYAARGADPDAGDTLTYRVVRGPGGLTMNHTSGLVSWSPSEDDTGDHRVILEVKDSFGRTGLQEYVLSVHAPVPNRPPLFDTDPVLEAEVGKSYLYDSNANDPDSDVLIYTLEEVPARPAGVTTDEFDMDIDPATGAITWKPHYSQVEQYFWVTVKADDGRGRLDFQRYQVYVGRRRQPPADHHYRARDDLRGGRPRLSDGLVLPTQIDVNLTQERADRTVTLTVSPGTTAFTADVVFVVDESGSMEAGSLGRADGGRPRRGAAFVGITSNRYGLVGYGAASPAAAGGRGRRPVRTATQLAAAVEPHRQRRFEDGYWGIDFALDTYTFRPGAAVNVILITDEDRDRLATGFDQPTTFLGYRGQRHAARAGRRPGRPPRELQDHDAANVVINGQFQTNAPGGPRHRLPAVHLRGRRHGRLHPRRAASSSAGGERPDRLRGSRLGLQGAGWDITPLRDGEFIRSRLRPRLATPVRP